MKEVFRKMVSKRLVIYLLASGILMAGGSMAKAKDTLSPKEAVALAKKAMAVLESKGKAGIEDLKGSDYVFGLVYPVVCDFQGQVVYHPIKPQLQGKANLVGMKDKNGKLFVSEILNVAREEGSGWVDYVWPKPGEKKMSTKVSYVLRGKMDEEDIFIMVGLYDFTKEECEKMAGK
ncbi:MAG: cache domain-containing protein [Thermodesulfobacteriota bacterium]|nr:cache domain-containing protein [Thermodesulfobacteriota bacterium]